MEPWACSVLGNCGNPRAAGMCAVRKIKLEPNYGRACESQRFGKLGCLVFRKEGLGVQLTPSMCEAYVLSSVP